MKKQNGKKMLFEMMEKVNPEFKPTPKHKDLFNVWEDETQVPANLREILERYQEKATEDGLDYPDLEEMLKEVEAIGYTFEYGLDAVPFALRPIGVDLDDVE